MSALGHRLRRIDPLARNLLIFAVAAALVLNLVVLPLARNNHEFTLYQTFQFLSFKAGSDSWWPMKIALDYLRLPGGDDVYQGVFHENGLKFQYPLTSLLPIDAMRWLLPGDVVRFGPLNFVSWLAVWGTALFVALILRDGLREHLGERSLYGSATDEWILMVTAACLTLTFYPVVKPFSMGQIQPWINCAFAAMIWLCMRRQPLAAGVMAGLICVIKPQLALLLVWAALRGQWRFAGALLAVAAAASVASLALYGWHQNVAYVSFLSDLSRHGEAFPTNQSVNGLLNRVLSNGNSTTWDTGAFPPFNRVVYAGTLMSSMCLIAAALFWRRTEHDAAPHLDLAVAGLSFTMASPIAWDHHYGILMPIFAALLPALIRLPVFGIASLGYLGGCYVLSGTLFDVSRHAAGTPLTFVQSYIFFSSVAVLVALYRVRHASAAALADAGQEQPTPRGRFRGAVAQA